MTKSIQRLSNYEPLHNTRVLVIGASSFIGTHLVSKLLECGAIVHATYRSDRPDFPAKVTTEYLDITDLEAVKNRLKHFKPDYIFNLAAFVNGSRNLNMVLPTMKANLGGNLNLLVATAEMPVKRLILIGSMDEYQAEPGNEVSPPSPYAASKMASSAYAKMFHSLYDLPVVIARVFMTYGPKQKDGEKLIPYTINALLKGERPDFGSGNRMVDWIYITDVIDGLIKIATTPALEGQTVCLGTGKLVSVRDVILKVFEKMDSLEPPNFGILPDRPLEKPIVAKVERTQQMIDWKPKVNIESGIGKTVNWYRKAFQKAPVL